MTPSERRLHPMSIVITATTRTIAMILPAVLVLLVSGKRPWQAALIGLAGVPYLVAAALRYATTSYRFDPDEIVIRTGFFSRNERHIRYGRIQNVELVRKPLHRLFGVTEVRVETAGGDEPEARLEVLSMEAAEEMRDHVFAKRAGVRAEAGSPGAADPAGAGPEARPAAADRLAAEAAPARTLLAIGARDLAVFGLTNGRGALVFGAILGLAWEAEQIGLVDLWGAEGWRAALRSAGLASRESWSDPRTLVALVAGIVVLAVAMRLAGAIWALIQFHGFTLTRHGAELRSSYGLLTRVRSVIPLHRIQLLTIEEPLALRLFGRAAIRVETAGAESEASAGRSWLAPSIARRDVRALVAEVLPGLELEDVAWQGVHPRAGVRAFRQWMWVLLGVTAVAVVFAGGWAALPLLPLAALAWFGCDRQMRRRGYAITSDHVLCASGWLHRRRSAAPHAKVQVIALSASPFDRRWKMANVAVDTAGGGAHPIQLTDLGEDQARDAYRALEALAAPRGFRW